MILTDISNRLQTGGDLALRPVPPLQEITDKLGELVTGQRLQAEIQALLPNGTYRALINQRSVTLALPFTAKTGDTIELEVADSDGKLTLAVVSQTGSEGDNSAPRLTAASLSDTGQLISTLLGGQRNRQEGAAALPLNGNQPIAAEPPKLARDLLPLLEQAIVESGMFYESHQAEWVEGRYSKEQLLHEPQARLAVQSASEPGTSPTAGAAGGNEPAAADNAQTPTRAAEATASSLPLVPPAQSGQPVAAQTETIVQQQLEAFATQNYSWHGQIWPGQQLAWEIENGGERGPHGDSGEGDKWQTRLRLTLPNLGAVDARLYLQGTRITLAMIAASADTRALLHNDAAALRSQFAAAGLDLASLGVAAPVPDRTDAAVAQ